MKIKVDRKVCSGHALCAAKAPDVYTLDDDGYCNADGKTVPADKVGGSYSWVVMLPNLGTKASADPGETYYIDDIKLISGQ